VRELHTAISFGAIERDENGDLIAFLRTRSPLRSLQELNEHLGVSNFEMVSHDKELSSDASRPTTFLYKNRVVIPVGEELLDLNTWKPFVLPSNITYEVQAVAEGYFQEGTFAGTFSTDLFYLERELKVALSGSFELHVT